MAYGIHRTWYTRADLSRRFGLLLRSLGEPHSVLLRQSLVPLVILVLGRDADWYPELDRRQDLVPLWAAIASMTSANRVDIGVAIACLTT